MTDEEEVQPMPDPVPNENEVCLTHPVRVGTFKRDCVYCKGRLMAGPTKGHVVERQTF